MWHFRHQHGIGALLVSYQLGTANTVNVSSRKFSVKSFQARKWMLCRKIFSLCLDLKSSCTLWCSILNLLQWFILFPWGKSILPEALTGELEECEFVGEGFCFYCVVSSLHLEITKSILITSLRLIGLWWLFENLLHGCVSVSLEKGFTMKGLVV